MASKSNFLKFIILVGDIILMYGALLLALAIRYGDFSFLLGPKTRVFLWQFSIIHLFWLLFLSVLDFYEIPPLKKAFNFFSNLIIFLFLAGTIAVVYFYVRPEVVIAPKTILVLDVFIFGIFFVAWRYLFHRVLKLGNFREKIIIIGPLRNLSEQQMKRSGFEVVANFDFSSLEIPKLKQEVEKADSIVLDPEFYKRKDLVEKIFQALPLRINYLSFSDFYENLTQKVPVDTLDKVWFLENISKPERRVDKVLKRGFDIFFSLIGLLITAFLFPFIALAIKIDSPGPIFYSQKRVGKDGKIFTLHKFRSMRKDAEKEGPQWALPRDPRITRVGRILRKLYLDEFPQFYNILKGDISFVGPRPERPEFVEKLKKEIPYYDIRHLVKPGFTGWAQINYGYGNSVEDAKEKFQYDLYYIKNRSFFLDLGIILKTIKIIFR